jgi:hypothetical protein
VALKDIELCCWLGWLRISPGVSTGSFQWRQRDRYALSFGNSYFHGDDRLKVEIEMKLAELPGSRSRHWTLPSLKRHGNAVKPAIWFG